MTQVYSFISTLIKTVKSHFFFNFENFPVISLRLKELIYINLEFCYGIPCSYFDSFPY